METKTLNNVVVLNKYGTTTEWNQVSNPRNLYKGEIAFEVIGNEIFAKVGSGDKTFKNSSYLKVNASDVKGLADFISTEIKDTNTQYQIVSAGTNSFKLQSKEIGGNWTDVEDSTFTVNLESLTAAITANANAISAMTKDATITTFKGVEEALAGKISTNLKGNYDKAYTHSTSAHAPVGAQANIIESVKVNGTALTITNKEVDITVPTNNNQLTNGAGYLVASDIANKADKKNTLAGYGITDAMTAQAITAAIEAALAEAKKHADDNDADTKYGIEYDSENKQIKLVSDTSKTFIDARDFIKDGMISTVVLDENDDLVITFNTDAGKKEDIKVPLDKFIDVYTSENTDTIKTTITGNVISAEVKEGAISKTHLDTSVQESLDKADSALQSHQDISNLATKDEATYAGKDGDRIKVSVSDNNEISADLKVGTISKTYLDANVQASLGKADTALQSHQDISNLATKTEATYTAKDSTDIDITISEKNEISAEVKEGAISKSHLDTNVQASLGKADSALQASDISNLATKTEATYTAGKGIKITKNVITLDENCTFILDGNAVV